MASYLRGLCGHLGAGRSAPQAWRLPGIANSRISMLDPGVTPCRGLPGDLTRALETVRVNHHIAASYFLGFHKRPVRCAGHGRDFVPSFEIASHVDDAGEGGSFLPPGLLLLRNRYFAMEFLSFQRQPSASMPTTCEGH